MLALFVLVPFFGLLLLNLPFGGGGLRKLAFPAALALALAQIAAVLGRLDRALPGGFLGEGFLGLGLNADALTLTLLLCVGLVAAAAAAVGRAALRDERGQLNFFSVLLLSMTGMNGAVLVTDVFSLYVFLEVVSVCSLVLIAFERRREALDSAFTYLVMGAAGTVMMLLAVGLLLFFAGGTSFTAVAAALRSEGSPPAARIAVGLFVCGLFVKGGVVPFHGWLPAAYSTAPTPVSVLLAGIVTKVGGIYGLLRLAVSVFPPSRMLNEVFLVAGLASVVVGALAALKQSDMKSLLAYSSISQVGYILLGLGCGTPLGIAAAILHLFNHSVFKALLFVNAAAVEQRAGTTEMDRLRGLGARMPLTNLTAAIGSLSTAGIPPFAGFWSKLVLVIALWQAQQRAFAALAALLSVVTLAYLLSMQRRVFFGKTADALAQTREASLGLVLPALGLAAITLAVGLGFPWLADTFLFPVRELGKVIQ